MRTKNFLVLLASAVCLAVSAPAATIQFTTTALPGPNQYRYNYAISGIAFNANQAVDLMFPAALYASLMNPVVGAGFTPLVLQPNNPLGVAGDFTILANTNNPSLAGPFSIDFTFLGAGQPGAQPYVIDTFDANGNLISATASALTVVPGTAGVPEPTAFALCFIGLLAGGGKWASRRFLMSKS